MKDKFGSWSELSAVNTEGKDYLRREDVRSRRWLVAAPHGGGIEPGTTEIAREIADNDLSFYSIEGIKESVNLDLHLTSHIFDEPTFLALAAKHEKVLAIHGCKDERPVETLIWVGGGDALLRSEAIRLFVDHGYPAELDTFTRGEEPKNLCNRGTCGGGLQLELSWAFRQTLFESLKREGRRTARPELAEFVKVVRSLIGTV